MSEDSGVGEKSGEGVFWKRLHRADDDIRRLVDVLHLSIDGIQSLERMVPLVRAIANYERVRGDVPDEAGVEKAERIAALAGNEVRDGFPLLHAQAALSLCAVVESLVWDLSVLWLMHNEGFVRKEPISSLKIELGEYEGKTDAERSEYLIGLLEDKVHARFASGVTKFERLLAPFGLDGFVGDSCREALFELFRVRNAVLHRGAVADLLFVRECPWLGQSVGDNVVITNERFGHYLEAALEYVTVLVHRIGKQFGKAGAAEALDRYSASGKLRSADDA